MQLDKTEYFNLLTNQTYSTTSQEACCGYVAVASQSFLFTQCAHVLWAITSRTTTPSQQMSSAYTHTHTHTHTRTHTHTHARTHACIH